MSSNSRQSPVTTQTVSRPKYRERPSSAEEEKESQSQSAPPPHTNNGAHRVFQPMHPSAVPIRSRPSPTLKPVQSPPTASKRVARVDTSNTQQQHAHHSDESDREEERSLATQMRSDVNKAAASPQRSPQRTGKKSHTQQQQQQHVTFSPRSQSKLQSLQDELDEAAGVSGEEEHREANGWSAAAATVPSAIDPAGQIAMNGDDAASEEDGGVPVLLKPMDATRVQLEAEIERLQKLLSNTPARAAAQAVRDQVREREVEEQQQQQASTATASVPSSPLSASPAVHPGSSTPTRLVKPTARKSGGMYIRRKTDSPTNLNAWMDDPRKTYRLARERVKDRELTLRAYISATTHLWVILLLRAGLVQLQKLRGSNAVRSILSLPFVRSFLEIGTNLSLGVVDYVLHTRLFHMLPGSGFVHGILSDTSLREAWASLPPLPEQEILPLTHGPLRPIFPLLSRLPLSGLFFRMDEPAKIAVSGEAEHPNEPGLEPASSAVVSSGTRKLQSGGSDAPVPVSSTTSAPSLASDHPLMTELLSRLETQSALIAFLQADRTAMQRAIEEMKEQRAAELERLDRQRQQQLEEQQPSSQRQGLRQRKSQGGGGSTKLSLSDHAECLDIPSAATSLETSTPTKSATMNHSEASSSSSTSSPAPRTRSFMSAAAEARLNELHTENIELRGLAGAQESSIQLHETTIQALTEETEILAERIYELEAELQMAKERK